MKLKPRCCILYVTLAVLATAQAQAFYNPQIGRFASRDPIGEWGGRNVYGFVLNNPICKADLYGLQQQTTVNGPSAAIFSWIADFDPSAIDLQQFVDAYTRLTGKPPADRAAFEATIFRGLVVLDTTVNPNPGNDFDGTTKQTRGWLTLQVSITCNCQGKIVSISAPMGYNNGYTRIGNQYFPGDGVATKSVQGGVGSSFVLVTADHENRLGERGQQVWDAFFPELPNQMPSAWRQIEYVLRCDRSYEIHYSGSFFPSHQAYLDGKAVGQPWNQSGFGAFVFAGGRAPGGQFHVERGVVP